MRELAQFFKALGDETRLKMLAVLSKHEELCVCDFEQGMGISQSKASRHLKYLLNAGVLEDRREAVWVYYRLSKSEKGLLKAVEESVSKLDLTDFYSQFSKWLKSKSCKPPVRK